MEAEVFMELFKVVAEMGNRPSRCEDYMQGDSSWASGRARSIRF